MTKERHHRRQIVRHGPFGHGGAGYQNDLEAKRPRRIDLGARTLATGILGNDAVDGVPLQERQIVIVAERAAIDDNLAVRQGLRILRRIDEAQEVVMLRLGGKEIEVLPADGEKHASRVAFKRRDRAGHVGHRTPTVARLAHPGFALERHQRDAGKPRSLDRIGADLRRERVGRIDEMGDSVVAHPLGETFRAAEPADTGFDRLRTRVVHPAGIGQYGSKPRIGAGLRQPACFAGSAENEGAGHD